MITEDKSGELEVENSPAGKAMETLAVGILIVFAGLAVAAAVLLMRL